MVLTYREAAKSDADLLIDIYNFSFYEDYIHYGECPVMVKQRSKWNCLFLNFLSILSLKMVSLLG